MIGRPTASTSGQYDGDGRCTPVPSPGWATSAPVATRTTLPSVVLLVLAVPELVEVRHGRHLVEVVGGHRRLDHPLEAAGVPRVGAGVDRVHAGGLRQLTRMLPTKTSIDTAMMNAPMVATMFQKSKP